MGHKITKKLRHSQTSRLFSCTYDVSVRKIIKSSLQFRGEKDKNKQVSVKFHFIQKKI